ncbi:major facilitator superfamily domain-containing protein [Boeremia exigua]|uniref:major facilitator superfamily domain-containing protein n=1 Tax=Boeremia exigua TaxID=749465 RepID=UPI001E8E05DC|nr:major facilitator superfamily domain-containing protein [Boeremia exigua]KAH6611874.1 major facilitator superfamily domain-containing protein [Boeremia exigua]
MQGESKVDTTVLPLLFLGLLVFQLDRMNLASALTDGFARDIGVNQNTINLGNQLMFLGIVVLEIPSNIILQRLGPRKWISAQVFIFGMVATLQVFVVNKTGFLVARMFLGLCEAGYIPGGIYTLSTWYTKRELAKRVAVFFFGMFGGNAISPVLASGILQLGGKRGMKGWQWLFLIEGVFTMIVAIALLFLLPGSPDAPRPLLSPGLVRFSEVDRDALRQHLETDDGEKKHGAQGMHIPLSLVWQTAKHYRRWASFVSTFAVFSTWSSLTTYTPTIIMALGFPRIQANALASVGGFLALGVVFFFGWLSDKTNKRGIAVIIAQICYLVVLIVTRQVHSSVGKWSRWGLWTTTNAFAIGYHPVHNSWVQLNCKDPRERSISIAMWVMSAISGLMVGTQYYRADDLPFYNKGLRTQIIMVTIGMFFAIVQELVYILYNRRVLRIWKAEGGEKPWLYTP